MGRGELPIVLVLGCCWRCGVPSLYVRHARRVDHPIIDLALMRIPTYAMTTIGGFLFRMGLGALPFLMPLMLQVGFGLDRAVLGPITFASAAGAMSIKVFVGPISAPSAFAGC